jgi:integral membrane protein
MSKWFKILGRLEGVSFLLLLFVAMPLKYYAHMPVFVKALGPIHGVLFLLYCASAYMVASSERWPIGQQLLAYVAAVLPFGTFVFEKRYSSVTN